EGERDPGRVDEEVLLGAGPASVDRARARFGAPSAPLDRGRVESGEIVGRSLRSGCTSASGRGPLTRVRRGRRRAVRPWRRRGTAQRGLEPAEEAGERLG